MGLAKVIYVGEREGDKVSLSNIYVHCCDGCDNLDICSHWVVNLMAINNGYKLLTKENKVGLLFRLDCDGTTREEIEKHINSTRYGDVVECPTGMRKLMPAGNIEPSKEIPPFYKGDVILEKSFEIF